MELQIKKEKTKTRAGQYIFLSCPEISYFQWHPFTLTRCAIVSLSPQNRFVFSSSIVYLVRFPKIK